MEAELPEIELGYGGRTSEVENNGHTAQVDVSPGNTLQADGGEFELVQLHFHSPSEHRVAGEQLPLEVHFVHKNERGELAVVGVLFRAGDADPGLASIWAGIPAKVGDRKKLAVALANLSFIPSDLASYRYSGSLTTPPCSEGVRWYVLRTQRTVSSEQVSAFVATIGENARPVQPLNARVVLR